MFNDLLVYSGGEVKALGEGRFGGYAVRYTDAMSVDLQGDFFTPQTDLELDDRKSLPLYFSHGVDPVLKDRRLGRVSFKQDDVGIWVQGQLEQHDRWLKRIYELIEQGVLGYSTGAIGHLVRRIERQGLAGKVFELLRWPLGEVSVTSTPAEPRNAAIALKSFELDQPSLKQMVAYSRMSEVERYYAESQKLSAMAAATLSEPITSLDDWVKQQAIKRRVSEAQRAAQVDWIKMREEAIPELAGLRKDRLKAQELVYTLEREHARRTKRIARTSGGRRR